MSKMFSSSSSGGVRDASTGRSADAPLARSSSRDERIGRLLDAVVDEGVRAVRAEDERRRARLPRGPRGHRLLDAAVDQCQRGDLGDVPEAGELSQRLLRGSGQAARALRP